MSQSANLRPRDPELLYDQAHHVTEDIWNGMEPTKCRCIQNPFPREEWHLSEKQWEMVKMTGLHHLAELQKPKLDNELITALVERWRSETNTFHFPFGEATVTLQDVSFIYGLPIDEAPLIGRTYAEEAAYMGIFTELLGKVPDLKDCNGSQVCNTWLKDKFGKRLVNPTPEEEIIQVRAFLLDLVSSQILTNTTGARAYAFILQFFRTFKRHSWGTAALANLYRQLGQASKTTRTIAGNISLLQYWAQSRLRIGSCEPVVEGLPFQYPLHHMFYAQSPSWVHNNRRVYRTLFDNLDRNSFNWKIYNPIMPELLSRTPETDTQLFLSCTYLIYMWNVEPYNPSRVMKQFGLQQIVPPVFRRPPDRILQMSRKSVDYSIKLKDHLAIWDDRYTLIIKGEEDDDNASHTEGYIRWFNMVSIPLIELPSQKKKVVKKPPVKTPRPRSNKESEVPPMRPHKFQRSTSEQHSTRHEVLRLIDGILDAAEHCNSCSSLEDAKQLFPIILENAVALRRIFMNELLEKSSREDVNDACKSLSVHHTKYEELLKAVHDIGAVHNDVDEQALEGVYEDVHIEYDEQHEGDVYNVEGATSNMELNRGLVPDRGTVEPDIMSSCTYTRSSSSPDSSSS